MRGCTRAFVAAMIVLVALAAIPSWAAPLSTAFTYQAKLTSPWVAISESPPQNSIGVSESPTSNCGLPDSQTRIELPGGDWEIPTQREPARN